MRAHDRERPPAERARRRTGSRPRCWPTGGDWMQMSPDGFWRPDVRAQFRTDDDAVVLMR
jgi:hypothetical protein